VLDFGLVKSLTGGLGGESLASATGITPGTPAYMAPELAQDGAVDGRADLYSLGCVAYYLLTGRIVFEAETALQMLLKHLQEPPVPPSHVARPGTVPPELERLVLACLSKQPSSRPAGAAELSRALEEIRIEPWTQEQAEYWWTARDRSHGPLTAV
jgi:serine/threonine-protein kinase